MEFVTPLERRTMKLGPADSWPAMVALAQEKRISISRLTYYKEFEVEHMKSLSSELLLLHDWPLAPQHINQIYDRRPESEIVKASQPAFVCCGHHHTAADFQIGPTRVFALNIISTPTLIHRHVINPGWAAIFEWNDNQLQFLQTWPPER